MQLTVAMHATGRLEIGDRIGDYRIEAVFGRGSLLDVCFASHVVLPRKALIRIATQTDIAAGHSLLREACIVEALTHPGVPRLYDCGRLGDGRTWVASERIGGRLLTSRPAFTPNAVAELIRDVASILHAAHDRGVVHLAVRPTSIMLEPKGRAWPACLTDWSGARPLDASPEARRIGPYDAPELAYTVPYDIRMDSYSLGVVAYEALSGTHLRHDDARRSMVADQLLLHVGQHSEVTETICQLAWLVDEMMSIDPLRRPAAGTAWDRARAIVAALADERAAAIIDAGTETEPSIQLARVSLRKPKWTPGYKPADVPVDDGVVANEIEPEKTRTDPEKS